MASAGLLHVVLFIIEDIIVWIGANRGISIWIMIGISLLIFYFFYNQILSFVKMVLNKVGI